MSNKKLVTPSMTNLSNRSKGAIHQAVYILIILYNNVPSHRETMFLYVKGTLYQILLCILSQHRSQARPLLCHVIYFFLHSLAKVQHIIPYSRTDFHLSYLPCFGTCDGFVNTTIRVIIPLIFCRSRGRHLEK